MISEKEANELISKLLELRELAQKDPKNKTQLNRHETLCVEKFKYLITMKTSRYKAFSNYDDLNQDGFEALCKAIKTFDPKKGSFFSWAHNYISTRISRSANLHTTIRFPLKYAKEITPHRTSLNSLQLEHVTDYTTPDSDYNLAETTNLIQNGIDKLEDPINKQVISLIFGIDDAPCSINKVCNKLNITRTTCINSIKESLQIMKENIKI